jgi:Zn finger protein HypA/HybF involved in hydrogenase expression
MHEVTLVADALRVVLETATAAGATRVERVTFAINAAGHVTEDAVSELFGALSQDTPATGAILSFEQRVACWSCWSCGRSFTSVSSPICPRCAESCVLAEGEPELQLLSIDIATVGGETDVPGTAGPNSAR